MTLCSYGTKLTREELARVVTPPATATHKLGQERIGLLSISHRNKIAYLCPHLAKTPHVLRIIDHSAIYQSELGLSTPGRAHIAASRGSASYQGGFCNLSTGQVVPLPNRVLTDRSS